MGKCLHTPRNSLGPPRRCLDSPGRCSCTQEDVWLTKGDVWFPQRGASLLEGHSWVLEIYSWVTYADSLAPMDMLVCPRRCLDISRRCVGYAGRFVSSERYAQRVLNGDAMECLGSLESCLGDPLVVWKDAGTPRRYLRVPQGSAFKILPGKQIIAWVHTSISLRHIRMSQG